MNKTLASLAPVSPDVEGFVAMKLKAHELRRRSEAKRPLRECDDQERWNTIQRGLMDERRAGC